MGLICIILLYMNLGLLLSVVQCYSTVCFHLILYPTPDSKHQVASFHSVINKRTDLLMHISWQGWLRISLRHWAGVGLLVMGCVLWISSSSLRWPESLHSSSCLSTSLPIHDFILSLIVFLLDVKQLLVLIYAVTLAHEFVIIWASTSMNYLFVSFLLLYWSAPSFPCSVKGLLLALPVSIAFHYYNPYWAETLHSEVICNYLHYGYDLIASFSDYLFHPCRPPLGSKSRNHGSLAPPMSATALVILIHESIFREWIRLAPDTL